MANKVRLDALEQEKVDATGEPIQERTAKQQAADMVKAARAALPGGVPDASPYSKFTRDVALAEAARLDMRLGALMTEAELLLVLEHMRQQMVAGSIPPPKVEQPPVPMQREPPVKIRNLKPSPTGRWVVRLPEGADKDGKTISVGGQVTRMRNGKIIDQNYYLAKDIQSMVDQGLKLIPIEDDKDEE